MFAGNYNNRNLLMQEKDLLQLIQQQINTVNVIDSNQVSVVNLSNASQLLSMLKSQSTSFRLIPAILLPTQEKLVTFQCN